VGLILWKVPLKGQIALLSQVGLWPLLLAAALIFPIQALKIAKWGYIARQTNPHIGFYTAAVSYLAGMAVGIVTPGRTGELTRVLYLEGEYRQEFLSLVIVDRAMDLATILLFAGLSVSLLGSLHVGLILALGAVLLASGVVASRLLAEWVESADTSCAPQRLLAQLLSQLRVLRPRVIGTGMLLSVIVFVLALLQFYWLLTAFGPVRWQAPLVSFPLLVLAGVLPITIAGIGIREGTAALVLPKYGVVETAAIGAAFLSFMMNTLLPAIAGAVLIAVSSRPKSDQKPDPVQEEET
jgi:uncharacterized membrane protein YbhN (UPF0104 family)